MAIRHEGKKSRSPFHDNDEAVREFEPRDELDDARDVRHLPQ